jgi:hypothetical protein
VNYIKRLESENAALKAAFAATRDELGAFRAFLGTEKFTGVESDGSRKDWISTADVSHRLADIIDTLRDAEVRSIA